MEEKKGGQTYTQKHQDRNKDVRGRRKREFHMAVAAEADAACVLRGCPGPLFYQWKLWELELKEFK